MAVAQQYHQNLVHYLRKEVNYNDPGIAAGVVIGRLPAGAQVTQALARVRTTFNAGTNPANYDNILGTADIAEGAVGNNVAPLANLQEVLAEADVFVRYTQTGAAATQGKAIIHIAYTVNNG